jgi:hypothetical protein
MLEYTRIFPCQAGAEVYRARRVGERSEWEGGHTDNPGIIWNNINSIYKEVYI